MTKKLEFTTEKNKTITTDNYHILLLTKELLEKNIEKVKIIFSIIMEKVYQQNSTYMNRFLNLRTEQIINKQKFTPSDLSLFSYCFANAIFDRELTEEIDKMLYNLEERLLKDNKLLTKKTNYQDKIFVESTQELNQYYDKQSNELILEINKQGIEPNYLVPNNIDIVELDMIEKYAYIIFEIMEVTKITKNSSAILAYNLEDNSLELVKNIIYLNNTEKDLKPKTRKKSVI